MCHQREGNISREKGGAIGRMSGGPMRVAVGVGGMDGQASWMGASGGTRWVGTWPVGGILVGKRPRRSLGAGALIIRRGVQSVVRLLIEITNEHMFETRLISDLPRVPYAQQHLELIWGG